MSDSWEPLLIETDAEGNIHFANRPQKIIIDVHGFVRLGKWIEVDHLIKQVSMTLDGETLTYKRVARTLAGHWACERV